MLFIGICGASASGKSTLAKNLSKKLGDSVLTITQDSYYRDHSHLSFEERSSLNYDDPSIFEHDLLREDMCKLLSGSPISHKTYDYTIHCRADKPDDYIQPNQVVILEGIHTFYDEKLRDMMDLKIYVHVDPDICLLRRIERDMKDRARDIEYIKNQYMQTVRPAFEQYIRNYEQYADLIVGNGGMNDTLNEILTVYINSLLSAKKQEEQEEQKDA